METMTVPENLLAVLLVPPMVLAGLALLAWLTRRFDEGDDL